MDNKYILIVFVFILGCQSINKMIGQSLNIEVKILNEHINVPKYDTLASIDTIYFEINNNSQYEYVFAIPETGIIFFNEPLKSTPSEYLDPFLGVGGRFINSYENTVIVEHHRGFSTENYDYLSLKDIVYIPPKGKFIFKMLLKFPHLNTLGGFYQTFENLKNVKYIEILFQPDHRLLEACLEEHNISLRNTQKPLRILKYFKVPITIN